MYRIVILIFWFICGRSSAVEPLPSKQVVDGSNPFARSTFAWYLFDSRDDPPVSLPSLFNC